MKIVIWSPFAEEFLAHSATYKSLKTINQMENPTIKSLTNFWGNPVLGKISNAMADKWVSNLRGYLNQNSLRTRILCASIIFNYAKRLELILKNPFSLIKLPAYQPAGRVLTDPEIEILKSNLSDEEFVTAWQKSGNMKEAEKNTGISASSLKQRATLFRKHGVQLKKFPKGPIKDWAALKELAAKLA